MFHKHKHSLIIYTNNSDTKAILNESGQNQTNYQERTNNLYDFTVSGKRGGGSEDYVWHTHNETINTICFGKGNDWDGYHRAGKNFSLGDSLTYIDRNDVNVTFELAWNITKYFTVNPDCWFDEPATYTIEDSPYDTDSDNDSINVTVSVTSILPSDKIRVNATVKSWPSNTTVFWKYYDFIATSEGTQKTFTVTLPPSSTGATAGNYSLTLGLFNSTGMINDIVNISTVYNDTDTQTGHAYLSPRGNSLPSKPNNITGPSTVQIFHPANFTTSSTDTNQDQLQYQWDWNAFLEDVLDDITEVGPYDSNENCTTEHTYNGWGPRVIQVHTRDDYRYLFDGPAEWNRYSDWSDWSEPFIINVRFFSNFDMSSTVLTSPVSAKFTTTLPSIQHINSIYDAVVFGGNEPYTYTWTFGQERYAYQQKTVEYPFEETGNYSVTLNVNDSDGYSEEFSVNVSVVNLSASFNLSIPSPYVNPNEEIDFTDTSAISSGYQMTNWTWDFDDDTKSYDRNTTHSFRIPGVYNVSLTVTDNQSHTDIASKLIIASTDETPPQIRHVANDISIADPWLTISIAGQFIDTESGIQNASVNITYPDGSHGNFTMMHVFDTIYGYIFNDTNTPGQYNYTVWVTDYENNTSNETGYSFVIPTSPTIVNGNVSPPTAGFGGNITITANVLNNDSGIDSVTANITYPDNSTVNLTMTNVNKDTYSLVFNDTWQTGVYNYSIWAVDPMNNTDCVSGLNFTVSAEANITVCTTKDTYTDNQFINLTDPPGPPSPSLGYELLEDGAVLHLWNQYDSYYFNTSSGIQLTNHKDEYWSHNVMMLGYYNNDQWNLLYRTDELTGFTKAIETDNPTQVNVTLWKDLTYAGYSFRLALRYHLGVDDNDLTIIPSIKNLGATLIPSVFGFGWELKDIQINMTTEGDYILVDQDKYLLNQTLDNSYTSLNETMFYLMEDVTGSQTQSLYLPWNPDLTYKLLVRSRTGQQNAPVTLFIRIGTLTPGQQKSTRLHWYDASQVTYQYTSYDEYETWESNPENMVDGSTETYAATDTNDLQVCNGNTCPGSNLGTIQKVELRAHCYKEGETANLTLQPMLEEHTGQNYTATPAGEPGWTPWFDITTDLGHGSSGLFTQWTWKEIDTLSCNVKSSLMDGMLFCSMVEIQVTYNTAPQISNPTPLHGSNGVGLQPWLNITVMDPDEDMMNVTWYTNATHDASTWMMFGSNSSIQNGTITQQFENATENGQWWYWKVKVEDGTSTTWSSVYKFYTGYQSKIENTDGTNISGYLLMQVQYYDDFSEQWVLDTEVVNQSTRQVVNISEQLGLDQFFNGVIRASDLTHGPGLYRVYAAFRDPEGNILRTDDDLELVAWWQFNKT